MNKEIQLDDRVLLAAVAVGATVGAWGWTIQPNLLMVVGVAVAITFLAAMVMTVILIPVAWFLNLRDGEGLGTKGAAKEFARRLVLYGFLAAAIFIPLVYAQRALHDTPLGWILGLITIYLLVRDSLGAVRLRKARSKLNTIDLSKSRDLTLK